MYVYVYIYVFVCETKRKITLRMKERTVVNIYNAWLVHVPCPIRTDDDDLPEHVSNYLYFLINLIDLQIPKRKVRYC